MSCMPPDSYDKSKDVRYLIMLYIFEKNYCVHGTDKVAMIICQKSIMVLNSYIQDSAIIWYSFQYILFGRFVNYCYYQDKCSLLFDIDLILYRTF